MSHLDIATQCRIRRPLDIVRAHFVDFRHHIERDVHKGIKYTILGEESGKQRVAAEFKVLGVPKRDEILAYVNDEGAVIQDFVVGDFAGGQLRIDFHEVDSTTTELHATIKAPLRGINKLLAPVIRRVVVKLTDKTIAEDIHDLENTGYQPS